MQRLIYGEPRELQEEEVKKWEEFLQWIEENGLEPLDPRYTDQRRIGLRYLTINNYSFRPTYDDLLWRLEQPVPSVAHPPADLAPFLHSGAFYISGRLSDLGHQPVLHIEFAKLKDISVSCLE